MCGLEPLATRIRAEVAERTVQDYSQPEDGTGERAGIPHRLS
jgi:hypothetical protein